ncbi:tetratricopeptide repeat protein [Streptomyces somaliensis]|uniref:Tetratricopeptide repeat protein n=1 Tax=Streptomyces somaliensis (strain ATCC 33201 / DSM 40738 / JCM 12659 / KCTC 9044 / NCTC 11332 / NRRL B-12077 / IP 733) TaxID=1134445 RepID=A0AA44DFP0_STRE0|nr:tetratricopeptide repeat protein [Streptomyces somaliensis]NKY15555.1 tetratricopeptide repeat protein [Streptomyces somaliensis DSM 40738]
MERALGEALARTTSSPGRSFRRRGVILADLAAVGVRRCDPEQAVAYGGEAVALAEASSSGYVARRLQDLCDELAPLGRDPRVAELRGRIVALDTP